MRHNSEDVQILLGRKEQEMTDHKFTDDEIVKALECCSSEITEGYTCDACPYINKGCDLNLLRDSSALINRQKAEIEKLKGQKRVLVLFWKEENKKLKTAKSEAIKEFAERLYDNVKLIPDGSLDIEYEINALVKEMTEEKDESQNT